MVVRRSRKASLVQREVPLKGAEGLLPNIVQSPSQKSKIFASRLRAARSAALTAHRAVIHSRRLRFAYPLHKGALINPS